MVRSFTKEEKALLLAYRKATGKPVVGKYSIKQLAEYNDWAEDNDKPTIDIDKPLPSDDEGSDSDAEAESPAGRIPRTNEKQEAEQDHADEDKPSRKRGRPPKVAVKRGRPPKSHKQSRSTPAVAQESLEDLERRVELEEQLAAVRAKRAEADMQLAAAAEKAAAAKMTEARAKVIAACATDNKAAAAAGDEADEQGY